MGVKYLASHIHKYPDTITHPTIDALVHVIEFSPFDNQKQVFFLYSEASEALVCLAEKAQNKWGADIIQRLVALLPGCRGKRLRAIGQALSKLSLEFSAPFFSWDLSLDSLEIELKEIENFVTKDRELSYAWKGRSLMILSRTQVMGVVKFATSQDNIKALSQESQWMDFLGSHTLCPDESFKVPLPIKFKKKTFVQTHNAPSPGRT
ncbi:MAG: hypothetical protein HUK40_21875 [Desulfobacter sp.]|nr:hypothetical protein [Desulfobacter sp.]